ncbi:MAG: Gfo/Idh/MocA family protein [Phycisphaerae bacterium]
MKTVHKERYALVGTGGRGITMYARAILRDYGHCAELVGVFDTNPARMANAVKWLGSVLEGPAKRTPVRQFTDFDAMLAKARPDCVIIASRDCTHADYAVRALRAGKRVYVEKPLCTTAGQCREILAAVRDTGGVCLTTHNMRYDAACTSVRSIIEQGRLGKLRHVVMEDTLDRGHGADYFRRWHSRKANTGGLQIHKSSHHLDLLNWWIDSKPARVFAQGGLRFYGRNNPYHGKHCRGCPHARRCPLYVDYTRDKLCKLLYFDAEHVDGYWRDGCVWDPAIDIEDQLDVTIAYANGVEVAYSLVAYAPNEYMRLAIDGTMGRLEYQSPVAGAPETQKLYCPGYPVMDVGVNRGGGDHGGADPMLLADFIGRPWDQKPTRQMASVEEGVQAVLIGAAINKSLATGGTVDVQALLERG